MRYCKSRHFHIDISCLLSDSIGTLYNLRNSDVYGKIFVLYRQKYLVAKITLLCSNIFVMRFPFFFWKLTCYTHCKTSILQFTSLYPLWLPNQAVSHPVTFPCICKPQCKLNPLSLLEWELHIRQKLLLIMFDESSLKQNT